MPNQPRAPIVLKTVKGSVSDKDDGQIAAPERSLILPPTGPVPHMLIRMPSPDESLELPRPRRLIWQAAWSMAESLGLPFGAYIVISDVVSPDAGLLAGTSVVWLLILLRKIVTGSASALLMISAVILTIQTAVAISTGYLWMFELQFPIANLAMCVVFARTAPTRKPLVTQLAAEVVALKENDHPGLHRFFQDATWFWAGLFLLLTAALGFMMVTEPFKLFMLLSTLVTIGLTVAGAAVCAVWFFAVMRRLGLHLQFSALSSREPKGINPFSHAKRPRNPDGYGAVSRLAGRGG
jgi:hypothetical protein